MEAFQAFRLIFGLIISAFVLYFIISYVGTYSATQEDIVRGQILKAFRDISRDVWAYGVSTNFSDFGRLPFTINFDIAPVNRPILRTDIGEWELPIPTFFTFGKSVWIDRTTFDLGWWQFRVVTAQPETVFVFNPKDRAWVDFAINLVELLPDTAGKQPRIQYAYCPDIQPMDKITFISINPTTVPTTSCEMSKLKPHHKLIVISSTCSTPSVGICITPPTGGVGQARLAGSTKSYSYLGEWPFGLLGLMIGYTNSSVWGLAGDEMYQAANIWFKNEIGMAAQLMAQRATLLKNNITGLTAQGLDPNSDAYKCWERYKGLSEILNEIEKDLSGDISGWNWNEIATDLADAKAKQQEIEARC